MKRLDKILSLVETPKDPGKALIDVGTDHAYLPISLALADYPGSLIASDIHSGPLETARRMAQRAGVEDRISFRLSDGLQCCDPSEADTIVIAGMGGDLICTILDHAEWTMDASVHLILQPMTKAEVLRFWLCNNGYEILSEHLIRENKRLFQILSVRFSGRNTPMTDAECFLGRRCIAENEALYDLSATDLLKRIRKKISGLKKAGITGGEAAFYNEILKELTED